MRKSYQNIVAEAREHHIYVTGPNRNGYIQFEVFDGTILAWMVKHDGRTWQGFTSEPGATGTKKGTKAVVADWCLDWAVNGF